MSRQGVRTSRGDRHAAIVARNTTEHELEVQLLQRKRAVRKTALEDAVSLQAERVWVRLRDLLWTQMLRDHPLTDEQALRSYASAVVFESDPGRLAAARQAFERQADTREFANLVGPDWDTVATPAGFWAVRPGQDDVILMGPGYLATDGNDDASLMAMLKASAILGLKRPALLVKDGLQSFAQHVLEMLGFDWPAKTLRNTQSKPVKRP